MEKGIYASTRAKFLVLLAKPNKWEDEAIDKEEKLSKAKDELNENSRHFEELREAQRRVEPKVEAYRRELVDVEEKYACYQEKAKPELNAMTELLSSIEIGYNLAMNSFYDEAKKMGLGEYYYQILNISITL